ncbi:hypothetical protein MAR_004550 [Mya arenaria]|uniref:Uncharacterized protein n=1 Tax=Mya arenaria TaxID=6604 RepID=A0ABY7EX60_MYAAR|nr:hypothetical protein MAR_004550 [Mya arenaria]
MAASSSPKSRSKTLLTIGDIKKSLIENDGQPVLYKSISNNNVKLETVPTTNGSNNAQNHNGAIENIKKGKKSRKRSRSSMKVKKGRLGNLLSGVQSGTDRHSITSVSSRGSHIATPNRVSSEPPSKIGTKVTSTAVLTFDRHGTGNGFGHSNHSHTGLPSTSRQVTSMYPPSSFISNSAKSNTSVSVCNNTHSRLHVRDEHLNDNDEANTVDGLLSLQAQGKPIVLYKLDVAPRIRSASSIKSDSTIKTLGGKETKEIMDKNTELTLTAFTCAVQQAKSQSNKPTIKYHNSLSPTAKVLSDNDYKSKEAGLASIYAPVFQTADKVSAQVEELKKVKKIFLPVQSEKAEQSFPAHPQPHPLQSQRAVKGRLAAMEKEAQKKREKQKQENVKMEKQMVKDREKQLKIKQRREV